MSGIPGEDPNVALSDITDPCDSDVLCGRGGAALRHPGNQTYRRLVNLNKGLYITCLKTEKLKISRSIVAAIREQKGRFLEKDSKSNTWYDIGDKKAVEKTSQALREGQPKLRQKIMDMGGGAAGTAALMESQYGHPGLAYHDQTGLDDLGITPSSLSNNNNGHSNLMSSTQNYNPQHHLEQVGQQHRASAQALQMQGYLQNSSSSSLRQQEMHHGMPSMISQSQGAPEINADILQRLSLSEINAQKSHNASLSSLPIESFNSIHNGSFSSIPNASLTSLQNNSIKSNAGMYEDPLSHFSQAQARFRPSLVVRDSVPAELGFPAASQLSLMSNFSAYGAHSQNQSMNTLPLTSESLMSLEESFRKQMPAPGSIHPGNLNMYSQHSLRQQQQQQQAGSKTFASTNSESDNTNASSGRDILAGLNRRDFFARMKYNRPPSMHHTDGSNSNLGNGSQTKLESQNNDNGSGNISAVLKGLSQHSLTQDGMPDICMVESSHTVRSNLSSMPAQNKVGSMMDSNHSDMITSSHHQGNGLNGINGQNHGGGNNNNNIHHKVIVETAKVVDRSMNRNKDKEYGDQLGGSRHSMMSGLSRISDASIDQSIFSDLSKKIGNVSTRSIAMSDISAIDIAEDDGSSRDSDGSDFAEDSDEEQNMRYAYQDQRQSQAEAGGYIR
jgi:hypothetical protein